MNKSVKQTKIQAESGEAKPSRFRLPDWKVKKPKIRIGLPSRRKVLMVVLGILAIIILLLAIVGLTWLRYRQACSYQRLVDQGKLVASTETRLCPDFVDPANWKEIIINAINPSVFSNLTVQTDRGLVKQEENTCTDELNPICWLKGSSKQLPQTDGFTNLMLIGTDTRVSGHGSNLKNTDSIMMVSVHNSTGKILLLSFPRDLQVYFRKINGGGGTTKINAIYAFYGHDNFMSAMEQITGRKVHYYVYLSFPTFAKIIDKFGRITINLEKEFVDAYPCADLPSGVRCPRGRVINWVPYGIYRFPKGKNQFDSLDALIYTRSRQFSSDYDRARRQQNLVRAILDNVLKNDKPILEKVQLGIDIYELVQKEMDTNIQIKDGAAVLSLIDKLNTNVAKVVVDPTLDGGRIVGSVDGGNGSAIKDTTYRTLHNYLNRIWNYLPYYTENPKVLVINATGKDFTKDTPVQKWLNADIPWRNVKVVKQNLDLPGTRIYDLTNSAKSGTVYDINNKVKNSLIFSAELDEIKKSSYGEDIVIVVGKDIEG